MTLLELLDLHNVPYREAGAHHHVRGDWIGVDCPTCSPGSSKFKLGIHPDHLSCSCWTCGPKKLVQLLVELLGVSQKEAYALVKDLRKGLSLGLGGVPEGSRGPSPSPGRFEMPTGVLGLLKQHRDYLRGRGLDPDEMERLWGLKGLGIAPRLSWRIWIPVLYRGESSSWTTRAISDEVELRYINARPEQEKLPLKSLLLGEDYVRHSVVVCEGPFDVFKIGPGAVATMGVNYTREQLLKLTRYPSRAVLFDSEPAAQRRAQALLEELAPWPGETVNLVLDSKDPGSATPKEIRQIRKFLQ